jgi:H+/Cl- antiporter ClcA
MEINWIAVGWIIDMVLNGFVWLVIAAIFLILVDMTDAWTRKAISWVDKTDKWIRKLIDNLFEWIQNKNLKIISSIILLIVFGILSQLGIIPKLIS